MPEFRLENSIVDDRYRIERCLGGGSYAEIFLAYDQARGDEPVIIKALNASLQGTPDVELERTLIENFQNEAIALDKVRHPHIIRRLGHGTAADLEESPFHYLVLEYMRGGDLLSLCRNRALSLDETLFYFQQVAEALSYAHSQQVIHRDIKPNNLLLSEDHSVVKVADFGVAKMTPDDSVEITRVGTNIYAPPEHHPDSPEDNQTERLTPSADIYSLAKTIYTAMTGRAPRQFSRRPITELPAELAAMPWGDELLAALKKATASRVAERYQSVQEFWNDFAQLSRYTTAGRESDPEATIVRSRLRGTSLVARPAPQPNFQAIVAAPYDAPYEVSRPQKARIVVELPQHAKAEAETAKDEEPAQPAHFEPQTSQLNAPPRDGQMRLAHQHSGLATAQGGEPPNLSEKEAAAFHTKRVRAGGERSFFENLREIVGSEWLRRVSIIFLAMALIGLAARTYYYFAGQRRAAPSVPSVFDIFPNKEGIIFGAPNVNLRNEPSRQADVIVWLPAGTRVRVLEERDGWRRIKILEWPDSPRGNAPDSGWVDGRYVKTD